jgi:hypothetical protein
MGRQSAGQCIVRIFGDVTMEFLNCRGESCRGGVVCTHLLQKLRLNVSSPLKSIQDGPPLLQLKDPPHLVLLLELNKSAPAVRHGSESDMSKSVDGL